MVLFKQVTLSSTKRYTDITRSSTTHPHAHDRTLHRTVPKLLVLRERVAVVVAQTGEGDKVRQGAAAREEEVVGRVLVAWQAAEHLEVRGAEIGDYLVTHDVNQFSEVLAVRIEFFRRESLLHEGVDAEVQRLRPDHHASSSTRTGPLALSTLLWE